MTESITFALIADFHYKKGAFTTSVSQIEGVLGAAKAAGAAFVLHVGDFCNDYAGSPELLRAFLHNPHGLAVYGVYGNHELEGRSNSMQFVTPKLTNREVLWGTSDGSIDDGSVGYYSFDAGSFRFLGLDNNYSFNEAAGVWQHNGTGSFGAPAGNIKDRSLGNAQLSWLGERLSDAAERGMRALVFSHFGFLNGNPGADAGEVLALFEKINKKSPGTVIMAASGHHHSEHVRLENGILHYSVNSVSNTIWRPDTESHYPSECLYSFTDYDADGTPIGTRERPVAELSQARHVWFFTDPLYAIVTVSTDGHIEIKGSKTDWLCGVVPPYRIDGVHPWVSDHNFDVGK